MSNNRRKEEDKEYAHDRQPEITLARNFKATFNKRFSI